MISDSSFATFWTASFLGWLPLTYQYLILYNRCRDRISGKIRRYNSTQGYDQSVDKSKLAQDYLLPIGRSAILEYSSNNGLDYDAYLNGLEDHVGKSHWATGFSLHVLGILIAISGITYVAPVKIMEGWLYLLILYTYFIIDLLVFTGIYYMNS